jgi:hypothetical protein
MQQILMEMKGAYSQLKIPLQYKNVRLSNGLMKSCLTRVYTNNSFHCKTRIYKMVLWTYLLGVLYADQTKGGEASR